MGWCHQWRKSKLTTSTSGSDDTISSKWRHLRFSGYATISHTSLVYTKPWWRHQMEIFSALLALRRYGHRWIPRTVRSMQHCNTERFWCSKVLHTSLQYTWYIAVWYGPILHTALIAHMATVERWTDVTMGLLPDSQIAGCACAECRERFPRHHGLAIPTCITARAWRTCLDECRGC